MSIYCPRCGSQRLSPEVRFCSKCGLLLESVESLVATGGLIQTPVVIDPPSVISPRKKGIRLGAKLLFASIVLFPIVMGIGIAENTPGPILVSVVLFLMGVSRMAYARLFEEDAPNPQMPQMVVAPPPVAGALPSYRAPVSWSSPRVGATTGELQAPPSVTEHTTNLLDRRETNAE